MAVARRRWCGGRLEIEMLNDCMTWSVGPTMESSLRCSLPIVVVIACGTRSVAQALPALRHSGNEAQHSSGAAAAPSPQPPPGPWTFQCAFQGWEKASCLQLDGCAWCDTDEYGGACVTEEFAERVTRWSDSFHCQEQPEQHVMLK